MNYLLGWLRTSILLISASWVAGIWIWLIQIFLKQCWAASGWKHTCQTWNMAQESWRLSINYCVCLYSCNNWFLALSEAKTQDNGFSNPRWCTRGSHEDWHPWDPLLSVWAKRPENEESPREPVFLSSLSRDCPCPQCCPNEHLPTRSVDLSCSLWPAWSFFLFLCLLLAELLLLMMCLKFRGLSSTFLHYFEVDLPGAWGFISFQTDLRHQK
jgi:hypothetical protein